MYTQPHFTRLDQPARRQPECPADQIRAHPLLARPYGADDDTLYLQHVLTGEPVVISGITATVLACGHQASSALLTELEEHGVPAVGAGDCLAPRTVEEAVLEGLTVASEI